MDEAYIIFFVQHALQHYNTSLFIDRHYQVKFKIDVRYWSSGCSHCNLFFLFFSKIATLSTRISLFPQGMFVSATIRNYKMKTHTSVVRHQLFNPSPVNLFLLP